MLSAPRAWSPLSGRLRPRVRVYNRAAEKIFEWPLEQVRGQPLSILLPERFHASHAVALRRFSATGVTSRRMSGSAVVYGRRTEYSAPSRV